MAESSAEKTRLLEYRSRYLLLLFLAVWTQAGTTLVGCSHQYEILPSNLMCILYYPIIIIHLETYIISFFKHFSFTASLKYCTSTQKQPWLCEQP